MAHSSHALPHELFLKGLGSFLLALDTYSYESRKCVGTEELYELIYGMERLLWADMPSTSSTVDSYMEATRAMLRWRAAFPKTEAHLLKYRQDVERFYRALEAYLAGEAYEEALVRELLATK